MSTYAKGTAVSSENRRAEIERTLRRYGANAFGYAVEGDRAMIQFVIRGRQVRLQIAMPDPAARAFTRTAQGKTRSGSAAKAAYEQAVRQRWAALSLVIKAKLEAIEAGIAEFDAEFLSYLVLPDGSTVGERTMPQLAAAFDGQPLPALLPAVNGGGGRG